MCFLHLIYLQNDELNYQILHLGLSKGQIFDIEQHFKHSNTNFLDYDIADK